MDERFSRTQMLLGNEAIEKLAHSRVAVFGIGGVGGYALEALARSGVGALDLIDSDTVSLSNINRQIIALESTLGKYKTKAAAERIAQINPDCAVVEHRIFYNKDTADSIDFRQFDYVVDAVDTISAKLLIVQNAEKACVPVISSMGAGNKLDPTSFEVADIYQTCVCPVARVMRHELKKLGIERLKVVYSKEKPVEIKRVSDVNRRSVPASNAFVPPTAGLIIAGEVIRDLAGI